MYEYRCAHCGKRFEVLQKFSDTPLTVHEECGSGPVERLVSAPAFSFKGTGWYVTDYAKGNSGKTDGSSTSPSGSEKSDAKSEKSDSKTEKSDTKTDSSSSTTTAATPASTSSSSDKSDK